MAYFRVFIIFRWHNLKSIETFTAVSTPTLKLSGQNIWALNHLWWMSTEWKQLPQFYICLHFQCGSILKGKNLLPKEQILSCKSRSHVERTSLPREGNRKSQKLFPFVKLAERLGGILIHLNMIILNNIYVHGVFTEKPYSKALEQNEVYSPITTSSYVTSVTSK